MEDLMEDLKSLLMFDILGGLYLHYVCLVKIAG